MRERAGEAHSEESFPAYLNRVAHEAPVRASGQRVAGWIRQAPLRDLLYWRLPSRSGWDAFPELKVGTQVCESRWLADRFLLTYLQDWHTASLHDEFRWKRGERRGRVPVELMELRSVPQERLNEEVTTRAVDGIDLEVRPGTVYGLLGPNGAGKTTAIRIMLGLTDADAGSAHVLGLDSRHDGLKIRQRIGCVSERPTVYEWMTVDETVFLSSHQLQDGLFWRIPRAEKQSDD